MNDGFLCVREGLPMSDEDIETSEYQFGERAEDYGDDDDVVESTTGDIDDDDDVDGDNDGNSTDEDEPEDDESAEDGDAAAPSAAPSIGMITDLESCRLLFRTHTRAFFGDIHMFFFAGGVQL